MAENVNSPPVFSCCLWEMQMISRMCVIERSRRALAQKNTDCRPEKWSNELCWGIIRPRKAGFVQKSRLSGECILKSQLVTQICQLRPRLMKKKNTYSHYITSPWKRRKHVQTYRIMSLQKTWSGEIVKFLILYYKNKYDTKHYW